MYTDSLIYEGHLGWIEVICGSMFSGKTEELLRRLNRAIIANQRVKVFKPRLDTRYSESKIVSHNKNFLHSVLVDHSSEILNFSNDVDVIGIDEAQFFDKKLPKVCTELANKGIRVIVAGLDMDYTGKSFKPVPKLLAIAEHISKLQAICMKCGFPAAFSHRLSDSRERLLLGEKENYEALCRVCFLKATKE